MDVKERTKSRKQRGQTIVLLALTLVVAVAFAGLVTDVALLYVARGHLQRAIDAAALAAANKLPDLDQAQAAAYSFIRLHGYEFEPISNPLEISFPVTNPSRKIAAITGTVEVELAFLKVIGWQTIEITAAGIGEGAPLDVYLVLDLSHSMIYDTPKPWWWDIDHKRKATCPQTGCSESECNKDDNESWRRCGAHYCNYEGMLELPGHPAEHKSRNCDPLDVHIKNAAKFFVDQLDDRYDRIGVVTYDTEGSQVSALTNDFDAIKNAIDSLDAYPEYGDLCTNIGDGLMYANHFMSLPPPSQEGEGGRLDSIWAVILLTDGRANRYRDCSGCPPDCEEMPACQAQDCIPWTGYCTQANDWALDNAWVSWENHKIVVYTIAYGSIFFQHPEYRQLMIDIADITDNGEMDNETLNFWAVPDEAGLREALAEIAERIYTRLLR